MAKLPRYKLRKDRPRPDKSTLWMPLCPFCGEIFSPPEDIPLGVFQVFGGRCGCGAVYTCDPTGKNEGEVFMDALALAAGGYEEALGLDTDEYEKAVLMYDIKRHRLIPKNSEGPFQKTPAVGLQRIIFPVKCAKIVFIKINKYT